MIVGSFIFFLALFLGIGLYAHLHSRHSHRDYLLASQETPPWLAGLSAGATANSGYMFTGLIGYAYLVGLPSIWLGLGMIIGDIVASSFIHRRLRSVTNMGQAETYAGISEPLERHRLSDVPPFGRIRVPDFPVHVCGSTVCSR